MRIYENKIIGKGKITVNILFHKTYKDKKTFYHYFWIKNINNIKNTIKNILFVSFVMKNIAPVKH